LFNLPETNSFSNFTNVGKVENFKFCCKEFWREKDQTNLHENFKSEYGKRPKLRLMNIFSKEKK